MEAHFLFDGTPAAAVCREAFEADLASARLTPAFRAFYRLRPLIPLPLRQWLQRRRNRALDVPADWFLPLPFMRSVATSLA